MSAMRSSGRSIPIDMQTKDGVIPISRRAFSLRPECTAVAEWQIKDSVPTETDRQFEHLKAMIAHFAEATKTKSRQMPDETTRLLADLVARGRQIVELIAAEGQRARRMNDKRLTKSVARLRKALGKELSALDTLIGAQIRGSTVWAEKEDSLRPCQKPQRPRARFFRHYWQ
jgi:hypothetical protein